ncbi:MAG: 23S rRNA (uracil(1939)-C(5))-methyltransferase RlmD [Erysipelotrichaceae bacterium]|nr:23S rRNA (uracil(1939)-C(5))-methyltransferase RlmD [Erysipelotrichaceae bacterium]
MKKNDRVTGICESYTFDGHGVVKINGFPLFVKGILKGEEAEIVITKLKKTYGFGKWVRLLQESKERVEPMCSLAKQCGGCQLQHMSLKEQKAFKKQRVEDVLRRIGGIDVRVEDVLSMEEPFFYRNKGQIPIQEHVGEVKMGFYRIHSNEVVDMDECPIQSRRINEVVKEVRSLFKQYPIASYFRHILVKHAFSNDQIMVVLIARQRDIPKIKALVQELVARIPNIKSVLLQVNKREDNVILGDEEYLLYGSDRIVDKLQNLSFQISSRSFYQVNPVQTEVLYGKVLEFARLQGTETVLDLYCGVGTISMFLAQKAKSVIGIEVVPEAIEDAKMNAYMNGIENISFICSDAARYATQVSEEGQKIDVVVVDPPRKGCDEETLQSIARMDPKRLVYVSCDPATLARDLKVLGQLGFKVEKVQPVDMFGQTYHVETIVLLSKVNISKR